MEVRIAADRALETMALERWQLRGFDRNYPVTDPGFAAPERDPYELRAGTPGTRAQRAAVRPHPVAAAALGVPPHRDRAQAPGPTRAPPRHPHA